MKRKTLYPILIIIVLFLAVHIISHFSLWKNKQPSITQKEKISLEQLNVTADAVDAWFNGFVRFMLEPLNKMEKVLAQQLPQTRRNDLFEIVKRFSADFRYGGITGSLSLFDDSGQAVAWSSTSNLVSAEMPVDSEPVYSLRKDGGEFRFCSFRKWQDPPLIAASEFLIESKLLGHQFSDLVPEAAKENSMIQIELYEKTYQSEELRTLFERLGKRFLSKEEGVLYLALKPGKSPLAGVAKIAISASPGFSSRWADGEKDFFISLCILCACIIFLFLFVRSSRDISGRKMQGRPISSIIIFFLLSTFSLWLLRIFLLSKNVIDQTFSGRMIGPIYFGAYDFGGLFRSPADMLVTAAIILVQAALCVLLINRLKELTETNSFALFKLLIASGLSAFLVFISFKAAALTVQNSRINVLLFEYENFGIMRLSIQISILLLFFSAALPAITALRSFTALLGAKRSSLCAISDFRSITAFSLIIAVTVFITLDRSYFRLKSGTILQEFKYEILQQEAKNRKILEESLKKIGSSTSLFPDIFATPDRNDTIAFELWEQTELSTLNTSSSLEIYNRESKLISRFTQNLPGFNEKTSIEGKSSFEPLIFEEEYSVGSARGKVFHGELPVISASMISGIAVIHILNQPENIPFLTIGKSFSEFYKEKAPSLLYSELIGGDAPFIVYDREGKIIFSSVANPPPLPERIRMNPEGSAGDWTAFETNSTPYKLFALQHQGRFFVTGYPKTVFFKQMSIFIRIAFFSLILGYILLVIGKAIGKPSSLSFSRIKNFLSSIRQSYYRKLLAAIMIASLIPLLALAFVIRGYISSRAQEGIFNSGLNALASSRRVMKDYLSMEIEDAGLSSPAPVSDEVLYWLNKIVRQDINIYSEGLLRASSKRDLFLSGLLPYRLDSEAYQKIILEDEPSFIKEESSGKKVLYTLYAALDIPGFREGVISIPLNISQSNILRETKNIGDVILIMTICTLCLLALIGYFTASSISKPIVGLVNAISRLAAGDYETRIHPSTSDETRLLTESFNEMAASLKIQREDLKKRKDYIEKIINNITAGVISTDKRGNIVTLNPAAASLLSAGTLLAEGDNLLSFFSGEDAYASLKKLLEQSLLSKQERIESEVEISVSDRHSRLRIVLLPFLEEDPANAGRILVLEDITEMIRSNRLAAWAEMAKNIAHEIKNPLTPIQLSAEHLRKVHRDRRQDLDRVFEECLSTIMKQVKELRRISEDFSSYAKLPELKKELMSPIDLLKEAIAPYRTSLGENMTISEDYRDVPQISVDRRVMKGALTNIVENSIQAIAGHGEIRISVSRSVEDPSSVLIIIEDNGEGVPKDNLDKLFDPYFSTKEHGTGIGLAITKKVVEEHGGMITAESEPKRGTRMIITLPSF